MKPEIPTIEVHVVEGKSPDIPEGVIDIILKKKPIRLTLWLQKIGIRRKEIHIHIFNLKDVTPDLTVESKDYFMFMADFGRCIRNWFTIEISKEFEGGIQGDRDFIIEEIERTRND